MSAAAAGSGGGGGAKKPNTPTKSANILMPCLRVLGVCCGAAVCALGVYALMNTENVQAIIANVYRIIFGLLIILAEFRLAFLLQWFSFLTYFGGLGAFYVFVGGLALGSEWYEITLAITMCSMGLLYLFSACACSEYAHQHNQAMEKKVSAKSSGATPITLPSDADVEHGASPYREMEDGGSRRERAKMNDNPFGDSDADFSRQSGGDKKYMASRGAYGASDSVDDPFAHNGSKRGAYS